MKEETKKTIIRVFCWIIGIPIALLTIVMALSPVAKSVINNHGQDLIGRDMAVERVFINPFFGTVTVRDFHCKEANGVTDFVNFERLSVQINWLALPAKQVRLNHIHLDNFSGEVLSGSKSFNFSDLVTRFTDNDTTAIDTVPSSWTVSLKDIQLRNGRLLYHDMLRDNKWSVNDVNLRVPGLYFGRQQSNAGLQFSLPTGGAVTVRAGYVMETRRYAISFDLDQVNTDVVLPLVQDYLKIGGLGALVSGKLLVNGSLDNVRDMIASGALSMTGLQITDEDNDPIAGMDEMRLVIRRGDVARNHYQLDTLTIQGITGYIERTEKYNTFSRLAREEVSGQTEQDSVAPTKTEPEHSSPLLTWSTRYLAISAKHIIFEDQSMRKDFAYELDTMSLTGHNITNHGTNNLQLTAKMSDDAHLTATYIGGLDIMHGTHKLNAKLTGLQLSHFSPYVEHLFGYPVNDGILAAQIAADVNDGKLASNNKITVTHPSLGKKMLRTKAKYKNIPLKLSLDMLTSSQGIIVLDVPVQGDVASPKFKLGKVIGRALAKVFLGPLMGVRDNRELISPDEVEEMLEVLGEDTIAPAVPDSITEPHQQSCEEFIRQIS